MRRKSGVGDVDLEVGDHVQFTVQGYDDYGNVELNNGLVVPVESFDTDDSTFTDDSGIGDTTLVVGESTTQQVGNEFVPGGNHDPNFMMADDRGDDQMKSNADGAYYGTDYLPMETENAPTGMNLYMDEDPEGMEEDRAITTVHPEQVDRVLTPDVRSGSRRTGDEASMYRATLEAAWDEYDRASSDAERQEIMGRINQLQSVLDNLPSQDWLAQTEVEEEGRAQGTRRHAQEDDEYDYLDPTDEEIEETYDDHIENYDRWMESKEHEASRRTAWQEGQQVTLHEGYFAPVRAELIRPCEADEVIGDVGNCWWLLDLDTGQEFQDDMDKHQGATTAKRTTEERYADSLSQMVAAGEPGQANQNIMEGPGGEDFDSIGDSFDLERQTDGTNADEVYGARRTATRMAEGWTTQSALNTIQKYANLLPIEAVQQYKNMLRYLDAGFVMQDFESRLAELRQLR